MRATWVLTVVSETISSAAISAFESPRATSLKTSSSRAVSSSRPGRRRAGGRAGLGELLDQPAGDRGREQRVAARHDADAVGELLGRDVLEQEAAGARAQRVVDVLVEVEGREHQDLRAVAGRRARGGSPRCRRARACGCPSARRRARAAAPARPPAGRRRPRRRRRGRPRRRGSSGSPARTSAWSSAISTRTALTPPPPPSSRPARAGASHGSGSRRRAAGRPRARRRRASRARACRRGRGRRRRRARSRAGPGPRSRISSSSSRSPQRTRTSVGARSAYLSAFVSPSCTTRKAARSSPAGSERRSPSTCSSTGRPASRARSTSAPTPAIVGCGARASCSSSSRCSTPSSRRISASASRPVRSICAAAATARSGSRSRIRRAPPACTTITLTLCATTSCISRAIRRRSSAAARCASQLVRLLLAHRRLVQLLGEPRAGAHRAAREPGDRGERGREDVVADDLARRRAASRSATPDDHDRQAGVARARPSSVGAGAVGEQHRGRGTGRSSCVASVSSALSSTTERDHDRHRRQRRARAASANGSV